ncbi:MAG TPA: Wzz/FepE/Etk N-terminal domain-containing protein [Pyrinomonadaceae bacterium]|nr:Wzz/FepE/Etk N-terminal domain-containing protein [Pyrinomonadaceae bacterium]
MRRQPVNISNWTFRETATTLFRRKWLLIGVFVSISAVAALLAAFLPSQYQSRMKILVKNARADVVITPGRTNLTDVNNSDVSETQINSEIALLTSKDLFEQVVKQNGLDRQAGSSFWGAQVPPAEKAVHELEKNLEIVAVKKADIIEVTYTARSPETAAAVLQSLANLYLDKHLKLHRPPGTQEFFQNQSTRYGDQLQDAETSLETFQERNHFISLEQEKQLNLQKMADVKSRYLESVGAVKDTTERIDKLERQLATAPARVPTQSRSVPNQYALERLSTMMVELRNRRTQLLTKFRTDDRLVREVDQQLKDTTAALQDARKVTSVEQSSDINPIRQMLETEMAKARLDLAGQQARREDLAQQLDQYQAVLSRLEQASNKHGDLERRVKEAEENYQLYARKQEEARITDEMDQQKITNVALAETPVVQRAPVKPNRPLTLALGIFLAFFVSGFVLFVAELFRDTVHTPRELELVAGVPVIATLLEESWSTSDA